MMKQYVFAGFGGQGMLLIGKFLAMANMLDGRHVSWLPSYGPEMRGGTANCSVILSDTPVGSPIVNNPDVLIAMNRPSLEKFVDKVVPGGTILVDSSMIDIKVERTDVNVYYVDATKIADENNMHSCAIIILVGKMFKELGFCSKEALDGAIQKVIPAKTAAMLELNQKALEIGQNA